MFTVHVPVCLVTTLAKWTVPLDNWKSLFHLDFRKQNSDFLSLPSQKVFEAILGGLFSITSSYMVVKMENCSRHSPLAPREHPFGVGKDTQRHNVAIGRVLRKHTAPLMHPASQESKSARIPDHVVDLFRSQSILVWRKTQSCQQLNRGYW